MNLFTKKRLFRGFREKARDSDGFRARYKPLFCGTNIQTRPGPPFGGSGTGSFGLGPKGAEEEGAGAPRRRPGLQEARTPHSESTPFQGVRQRAGPV